MPDIKDSVGEGAMNAVHDIALVQVMLKVVKNAKGEAYLGTNYDGLYGKNTKGAITSFQQDQKIIPADAKQAASVVDKLGFIAKDGPTMAALNMLLPDSHKAMTIIANTKTVYLAGDAKDAEASAISLRIDEELDMHFRASVANLISEMFKQHKIVLTTARDGRRRTFEEQAELEPPASYSGAGESHHQFGRAVDLGLNQLQWVRGDGTIKTDDSWLNSLDANSKAKANAFWSARDDIAVNKMGLFRLNMERIHLQNFNNGAVSLSRSLADLLTRSGTTKWQAIPAERNNRYKSDFGYNKGFFEVGKANAIWNGSANVTSADLAQAKGVKVTEIKQKDIDAMKALLQADFKAAAQNWKNWKGVS